MQTHYFQNVPVEELLKLIYICLSNDQKLSFLFFWTQYVYCYTYQNFSMTLIQYAQYGNSKKLNTACKSKSAKSFS